MSKKILFIILFAIFAVSCTESSSDEEMQQAIDEKRNESRIEREKEYSSDNQDRYNVRRIPAPKEEGKTDND